jgi:hypothetical protein
MVPDSEELCREGKIKGNEPLCSYRQTVMVVGAGPSSEL